MLEGLDMSLEDIIIKKKTNSGDGDDGGSRSFRGRGHGGRGGWSESGMVGPTRRADNKFPVRTNPYAPPPPSVSYASQALHVPQMMVGKPTNSEDGTKLYISNLDYEVSNEDIKVLFSDVGELKRYSIHYDKSGRSKGTAEVVYVRHQDAVAAMKKYNHVHLDGKPMGLELVLGVNMTTPVPVPPMHRGILGNPVNSSQSTQGRIVGQWQDRGGDTAQRGSGRGRVRPQKVSAEDLDADLEKYRLERMRKK